MTDRPFHLVFVAMFLCFFAIRTYWFRRAQRARGPATYHEGTWWNVVRVVFAVPIVAGLVYFMVEPSWLAGGVVGLPIALRWLGVLLAPIVLVLVWSIQAALGDNFETRLHIREAHTLVTHGPYRYVRHPMYAAFYVLALDIFLLTANAWVAGTFVVLLTAVMLMRVRHEEAVLTDAFGDAYRAYMLHTGRFLPRLRRPQGAAGA
jgi:protein-S-isoprenylcysteine O-methyltransferase Ste14